ncbi:MAG: hypothetical protein LHV69_01815 [Elusimicrobia bacterium]|nr:hypothetical protein [Candidatus Obscuribacterium magneticum]
MVERLEKLKSLKGSDSPYWPALLSGLVFPGAGQLMNRDYLKGSFLICVTIGSLVWMTKVVIERLILLLPGSPEQWQQNPNMLREAVTKLVYETPGMFFSFEILLILVWIYSIIDAYVAAKNRFKNLPPPSIETDHTLR